MEEQVEEEGDLFADEIVPLPGGETLIEEEKEEVFEEDENILIYGLFDSFGENI